MSNNTSADERPLSQRRVRRRRNLLPSLLSALILGGLVAAGLLVARGYLDPLRLPSGDLRTFLDGPGEARDQDINWSDQDMRNWRVDLYSFDTDSIEWRANGDRAWPDKTSRSPYAFRYENMTIKVASDPSKAKSPDTIIRSPKGRADFTPGQDVLFDLESLPGTPVEVIGQGFSMTAPQARLKVPAKPRADKAPKGDTLTQQAAAHEFPVDRLQVDADGPVLLRLDAGLLRARSKNKKAGAAPAVPLPPITLLAEGGLEIDGQRRILCRGPVTIEVPPGSLPKSTRLAKKKKKKKKSALEELLEKGLRIRCGRLTITRPEEKELAETSRFHALFEDDARIYAAGEAEPFGRADRVDLELYPAGPERELLAVLGGPTGSLARQRSRLKTPDIYALEARGDVIFEGEFEARPSKKKGGAKPRGASETRRFALAGEHLIWRSGDGYARLDGDESRPARVAEQGGARGIQARRLESLHKGGRAFLAASGAVDARAVERDGAIRIRADRLRLRQKRERDRLEKPGDDRESLALDQALAWGLPGAPAVITRRDDKAGEELRFEALALRLSSRERRLELDGAVAGARRTKLKPGKGGASRSNAVELSGEHATIDFADDPFRMFGARGEPSQAKEESGGLDLERFRAIELRGAPARIRLSESGRPPIEARGERALWSAEGRLARLLPKPGGRVVISGEGGLYLEADAASWRQETRFLSLVGRPERRVLIRDGQSNRAQAALMEVTASPNPGLDELLDSRALELVVDLYDAVEILSASGPDGLKDSLQIYGAGQERKSEGPEKKPKKKKAGAGGARPVQLFASRGRLRLLEGPDKQAGYAVTGLDLQGAPGDPVRVRGFGDEPSDRFRLEASSLTMVGDERDRHVVASSALGGALPLLWTEGGDRFQGPLIEARLRRIGEQETARIRFPEGADGLIHIPQKDPEAEPNPLRFRSTKLWFEMDRSPRPSGGDEGLDREEKRARRRQERLSSMRRLEAEDRVYFEDEGYVGEGDRLVLDGAARTLVIFGRPARVRQKDNNSEVVQARISVAWKELLDED